MKVKIPISLKRRRRYVRFRVYGGEVRGEDIMKEISRSIVRLWGVVGSSQCYKRLVEFNGEEGVLATDHKSIDILLSTIGLISSIGDKNVAIHIIKISGTFKGVKESNHLKW